LTIFLALLLIAGVVFWWRWNRGWEELETGLKARETGSAEKPVTVPAEAIEKLLIHRVEPIYPRTRGGKICKGLLRSTLSWDQMDRW